MSGLSPLGLRSIPLDTQQLIELFYQTFNPEEAGKERLTDEELLISPLVEAEVSPPAVGGNNADK